MTSHDFLFVSPIHVRIHQIFALQSANIYPFLYMMLNAHGQFIKQSTVIWALLAIGVVGAVLMSVLWRQTASVFGDQHSVGAYICVDVYLP